MPQLLVDLPELRQHTMRGNPPLLMGGRRARQRRDFGAAAMEGSRGKLLSEWNRDVSDDAAALHGVHASCFPSARPASSSAGGLGGRCDRSLSGPRWGAPDTPAFGFQLGLAETQLDLRLTRAGPEHPPCGARSTSPNYRYVNADEGVAVLDAAQGRLQSSYELGVASVIRPAYPPWELPLASGALLPSCRNYSIALSCWRWRRSSQPVLAPRPPRPRRLHPFLRLQPLRPRLRRPQLLRQGPSLRPGRRRRPRSPLRGLEHSLPLARMTHRRSCRSCRPLNSPASRETSTLSRSWRCWEAPPASSRRRRPRR